MYSNTIIYNIDIPYIHLRHRTTTILFIPHGHPGHASDNFRQLRGLDHAAAGAKALASWLLPIRPRAEGTGDGNAIPQQIGWNGNIGNGSIIEKT